VRAAHPAEFRFRSVDGVNDAEQRFGSILSQSGSDLISHTSAA
jgi:hypothetical protein